MFLMQEPVCILCMPNKSELREIWMPRPNQHTHISLHQILQCNYRTIINIFVIKNIILYLLITFLLLI